MQTWHCPQCEYNLTGLTENRCPECGTPFDPVELARIAAAAWLPIPGWSWRQGLVAFAMVAFRAACTPASFARRFPASFSRIEVGDYWLKANAYGCLVTIVWGFAGCAAAHLRSPLAWHTFVETVFLSSVFIGVGAGLVMVATLVCSGVVAWVLDLCVARKGVGPKAENYEASTSWWGHVAMLSGFIPMTAGVAGACVVLAIATRRAVFESAAALSVLLMLAWFLLCVLAAVWARGVSGPGRTAILCALALTASLAVMGGLALML